jgi:uncharacterized protein YukE
VEEEKLWTVEEMRVFLKDLSKSQAETNRQIKETDRQLGKLTRFWKTGTMP